MKKKMKKTKMRKELNKKIAFFVFFQSFIILSYYLSPKNNEFFGGDFYVILYSLYFIWVYFFIKSLDIGPRKLTFICGLFFIGSPPLFENDHYRYLWEGKVIAEGENPYQLAPANKTLDKVKFEKRHLIAYNKLTSIYPPLAQLVFYIFSPFPYKLALIFLQIMFLIILIWIVPQWFNSSDRYFLALLPFLLKEFVQSVHIDLLAVSFFSIGLYHQKKNLYFLLGFLAKILSIIVLPIKIVEEYSLKKEFKFSIITFFIMLAFLIAGFLIQVPLSGAKTYVEHWYWNSFLMFSLLKLDIAFIMARYLLLSAFCVSYLWILMMVYKGKLSSVKAYRLAFAFLFLLSPVLHPWYLLWLIPLLKEQKAYVFYILSSCLAYMAYSDFKITFWSLALQFVLLAYAIVKDLKQNSYVSIKG